MAMIFVDSSSLSESVGLVWRLAASFALSVLQSSDELGELSFWLCRDESTVNIGIGSVSITRPHRIALRTNAAYCCRWSGVICLSVSLSRSWALQKRLNRSRLRLGCGLACVQGIRWGCTLAPSGEYAWTVHVLRRCGLFLKLLWQLVV